MKPGWQMKLLVAAAVALPAVAIRLMGTHPAPLVALIAFGVAILGAAFMLAWAAEAAQVDISAGLATAVLALIAVLPEYAVDLYFAYASGSDPQYTQYAAANMTGSNRLLLGLGWPVVAFVFFLAMRRRGQPTGVLTLCDRRRVELGYLALAGAYAFLIPVTRAISLVDTAVLFTLFALYLRAVSREGTSSHEFVGVAARIAELPARQRRPLVVAMFVVAAGFILAAAEPFAHALVESGKELGIDEFLLVQWLAPLASESPEFIVAALLALRGNGDAGLGTLLSSKVNQWTLLVGSLPLAHLAGGGGAYLELDARQAQEFFLTAAQTVLGFALLIDLRLSWKGATALLVLFVAQFAFPSGAGRVAFSVIYLVVAAVILARHREDLRQAVSAIRPRRRSRAGRANVL